MTDPDPDQPAPADTEQPPADEDVETKHIEDDGEPLGANFA